MDPQANNHIALPDVPAIGEVIAEKYRVEGILGVGGMGVVLSARHLQLGQTVAIKVLSVSKDQQQDSIDRFLREGRAAAALSSDHVVRIYDVGQLPSGIPFMVMERLRGKDLSTLLTEFGPLPVADAVEYTAQATVAIVEAHEVGIIHRDLKPSNLFYTRRSDGSPCIKVLDFGISKHLTDADTQTLRGSLTTTRQVMGSPAYMSPEQVRDARAVDHRTDIWALGISLYELLTQHPAFDADTLPGICAAIAADPPVPVRSRRPDVPEVIEGIISKCLEKTPANRFPSARDLLTALRTWQGKSVEGAILLRSDRPCGGLVELDAAIVRERKAHSDGSAPEKARVPVTLAAESAEVAPSDSAERSGLGGQSNRGGREHSSPPHGSTLDSKRGTLLSGRILAAPSAASPSTSSEGSSSAEMQVNSGVKLVSSERVARGKAANVTTGRILAAVSEKRDATTSTARNQTWLRRRGGLVLGLTGLVLLGATTAYLARRGINSATPVAQPRAEASEAIAPTRFVLRIGSNPAEASVFEDDRKLGVTPLSIELERAVVQREAKQFLIRKAGYFDVRIQQGDAPADVYQNVSLAREPPATAEAQHLAPQTTRARAPAHKSGGKPIPSANAPTATTVPGIRTTR